jgi:hypothetical protein
MYNAILPTALSRKYTKLTKYLMEGYAETPEYIEFVYKNTKYTINYKFRFSYDYSNGVDCLKVQLVDAILYDLKNDVKTIYDFTNYYDATNDVLRQIFDLTWFLAKKYNK